MFVRGGRAKHRSIVSNYKREKTENPFPIAPAAPAGNSCERITEKLGNTSPHYIDSHVSIYRVLAFAPFLIYGYCSRVNGT